MTAEDLGAELRAVPTAIPANARRAQTGTPAPPAPGSASRDDAERRAGRYRPPAHGLSSDPAQRVTGQVQVGSDIA